MFDPTAFENIRVVLEGIFYDEDLEGRMMIIDRNDIMNTAKLSRTYELTCILTPTDGVANPQITCKVSLHASLENLTAELLPIIHMKQEAGCSLNIEFLFDYKKDEFFLKQIEKLLREKWTGTKIKQTVHYEPFKKVEKVSHRIELNFYEMLKEEQISELPEICQQIMTILLQMEKMMNR
jgi:hypothetical protein